MNLKKEMATSIIHDDLLEDQYVKVTYPKKQIVLHHSAGWDNAKGMIDWWASNKERVATCCAIEDSGQVHSAFDSSYYAWHVSLIGKGNYLPAHLTKYNTSEHSLDIERQSIGVEICNWGYLTLINGEYHTYMSKGVTGMGRDIIIPKNKVIQYENKFRDHEFYERYTDHEIESLYSLLSWWGQHYGIPLQYHPEMWDINEDAVAGNPGVWAHVSYRTDKTDVHPQPELIEMLKALSTI